MRSRLAGVMILGISLIISAAVLGLFFYRSRLPEKTVRVVGAATKRLDSDVVKWRVGLTRNVGPADLKSGYALINDDLQALIGLMKANGLKEKDLTVQPVNANQMYSQYEKSGSPVGYNIIQNVYAVSRDLPRLEKLALSPGLLAAKGITLQSSNLEYYYSRLSEIKRELLAEATNDARRRAAEIARSSGDRIAKIESARVGVFQITEPYSTEVSDYGIYSTATKEKDITVTVSVVFSLK